MSERETRGRRPRAPRGRRRDTDRDAAAPESAPHADPGPRPLSEKQRAMREGRVTWSPGTVEPDDTEARQNAFRMEQLRSQKRRRNRKRRNVARLTLRVAIAVLVLEIALVLFYSPVLYVRTVRVQGNSTVTAERIAERMRLQPKTTIVRAQTARMRVGIEREPAIARATIRRQFPGTLVVSVRERTPWVTVMRNDVCYTADRNLIPFRKRRVPAPGLPLIALEGARAGEVRLGKRLFDNDLADATKCLLWALGRKDFPLDKVRVDPGGKLCLNRSGGSEVLLGSGIDLDKKLDALALLLAQRPELRDGDFAYINLLAYDAPAVLPRAAAPAEGEAAQAEQPEAVETTLP